VLKLLWTSGHCFPLVRLLALRNRPIVQVEVWISLSESLRWGSKVRAVLETPRRQVDDEHSPPKSSRQGVPWIALVQHRIENFEDKEPISIHKSRSRVDVLDREKSLICECCWSCSGREVGKCSRWAPSKRGTLSIWIEDSSNLC
jgi:hypothetical protein